MRLKDYEINPALIVIDVQNGFVSKGGSYDLLGMETTNYTKVIPKIRDLITTCRDAGIPVFFTQAVREASGIDRLNQYPSNITKIKGRKNNEETHLHKGTWDADIVEDVKPLEDDHIVIKRRDSAFHDTEIGVWLRSIRVDTLILCGIDTSICVETSLRDAFNLGYDIILVSDATASSNRKHYESTLENVKDYYGIVMRVRGVFYNLSATNQQ